MPASASSSSVFVWRGRSPLESSSLYLLRTCLAPGSTAPGGPGGRVESATGAVAVGGSGSCSRRLSAGAGASLPRAACWPQASSFPRRSWTSSAASSTWTGEEFGDYAVRSETRHEHLAELRRLYGFRSFSGGAARELVERLREEAPQAQSNEDLVRRFVEACRRTRTILPAPTTIERLCADALVDAERRIEGRIAERVPPGLRRDLEHLLEETSRRRRDAVRLAPAVRAGQQFGRRQPAAGPPRAPPAPRGSGRPLPRDPSASHHSAAPAGGAYFADGLRELPDNRRLAILAVCAAEWESFVADAVVETHDRIVGRTYREAARTSAAQLGDEAAAVREALRAFAELGTALIGARDTGAALDAVPAEHTAQPPVLHRERCVHPMPLLGADGVQLAGQRRRSVRRFTTKRPARLQAQ